MQLGSEPPSESRLALAILKESFASLEKMYEQATSPHPYQSIFQNRGTTFSPSKAADTSPKKSSLPLTLE